MKTKVLILTIIMVVLGTTLCFGENNDPQKQVNEYMEKQLNSLEIWKMEEYFSEEGVLNSVDLKSFLMDVAKGKKNLLDLINKDQIKTFLFKELKINLRIFISILVLAIVSSILKNLDNAFSSGAISRISNYVIFLIIISLSFIGYKEVLGICKDTIENMVNFMEIVIPIEIAILVTLGFPVTSTILNPVFLGVIVFINMVFKKFLLVTMALSFSILIINSISKNIKLKGMFSFIKQVNMFIIGGMLTIYLGILSIQGLYVTSFDKFSVKTVKFAIGNFIPIIGDFVSDSIDVLLSSSYLLKSVLGSIGLLILVGICIIPVLRILSVIIVYKIASIIIEPICEEGISSYLNEMGNLITIILLSVLAIGIMFFITIAILASIGNVTKL